jgi:glycosyltransferase involved in cell wall biosynthesis
LSNIRISLDARPLSTPVSGVGRLIAETLVHFPSKNQFQFYLHSHLPIHPTHEKLSSIQNLEWVKDNSAFSKKGGSFFLVSLPISIRKIKPNLFWGSQQVAPFFLPSNLPTVLTYCDLVLYKYPETMRKIAAYQQKFFQSKSIQRSKAILSISESTKNDVIDKFNYPLERSFVAYPGISTNDIDRFLKEEPSEKVKALPDQFLLSVSTIEPRKNYSFLWKVYKKYFEMMGKKALPWVIIGKIGWEREEFLKPFLKEIEDNKNIFLFQNTNDVDLHHIYKKSSIFLFASIYEGFGIPLLEALAHQKKCVTSDIPTFREIGGNSIPYLKCEEPIEWVEKILELLDSPVVPKISIEKFSWERSAITTRDVFNKVLNNEF